MIKKLISEKAKSITSSAILLGASTLASKLFGIVRESIFIKQFGAGDELDIYYAAFIIPDFIFSIIVIGALSAGFVPVFVKLAKKDKDEAFKTANVVLNTILAALSFLCLISIIFAPYIVDFIAPGFDHEKQRSVVELTRIMLLGPMFFSVSSVFGGILQSFRRFFVFSLAPIVYNVGIIIGAVFFVEIIGIKGLAFGVVLGSFMHLAIQAPMVKKLGFRYKFIFDLKNSGAREIVKMMIPRTLTIIANQFNFIIITAIASTLISGSLTIFNISINIQSFPLGVFAISFAAASFPVFSSLANDKLKFSENLLHITRKILFFIIPSSVLLFVMSEQIVQVVFGWGNKLSAENIVLISQTIKIFSISLFAQGLIPLFLRAFWSFNDAKTPFFTSVLSVILNIILAFFLSAKFGVIGLSIAFSISSIVNVIILYYIISRKINFSRHRKVFDFFISVIPISLLSGISSHLVLLASEVFLNTQKIFDVFLQGLLAGCIGIAIYVIISLKLKQYPRDL